MGLAEVEMSAAGGGPHSVDWVNASAHASAHAHAQLAAKQTGAKIVADFTDFS